MWKWTRKDENKSAPLKPSAVSPVHNIPLSQESVQAVPGLPSVGSLGTDVTHIGKSIVIKGDVSGSGNVYLDGELEGSIELLDGALTVGSAGRIRANLQAPIIVVQGQVNGNLYGLERAELEKSATVVGDIYTRHIAIEDGAFLEGNVRVHQGTPRSQTKEEGAAATVK
jgi:cytoskeletal protein CcmA (bactofilin family)